MELNLAFILRRKKISLLNRFENKCRRVNFCLQCGCLIDALLKGRTHEVLGETYSRSFDINMGDYQE